MTLTQTVYYTRKLMPVFLIGAFLFIAFFAAINMLLNRVQPEIPLEETESIIQNNIFFGNITRIKTASRIAYPQNPTFVLDTIEGKPITATGSAKIYFLPKKPTRFGYLQTISLMARTLDFDTDVIKHTLNDTLATFKDFDKTFSVDIADFNFEYKYNYENNPDFFENPIIPPEATITEQARQFLRLLNRYPEELARGTQEIIYLYYDRATNEFSVVEDASAANVVEVDFYRPDIDNIPVRPPRYFNSQHFVVMAFPQTGHKVLKAQLKFFEKAEENFGIYPLKSADRAYEQLKNGQGLIVTAGRNSNNITITRMFLAYFDPEIYQEYLQPVYVFLGENGFAAYVPAVEDSFVQ